MSLPNSFRSDQSITGAIEPEVMAGTRARAPFLPFAAPVRIGSVGVNSTFCR